MPTWRDFFPAVVPGWMQRHWGERFVVIHSLLADLLSEAAAEALQVGWQRVETFPDDGALLKGDETGLHRYPGETFGQHKARLANVWDTWQFAGHESASIDQCATLGFPDVEIHSGWYWDRPPLQDYKSQFWLFFPAGSHPVTGGGVQYGAGNTYDEPGLHYGPQGITPDQLFALRAIVAQWKPFDWICSGFIFEISGATYGTGHTYGEPGLTYGGTQAVTHAR